MKADAYIRAFCAWPARLRTPLHALMRDFSSPISCRHTTTAGYSGICRQHTTHTLSTSGPDVCYRIIMAVISTAAACSGSPCSIRLLLPPLDPWAHNMLSIVQPIRGRFLHHASVLTSLSLSSRNC